MAKPAASDLIFSLRSENNKQVDLNCKLAEEVSTMYAPESLTDEQFTILLKHYETERQNKIQKGGKKLTIGQISPVHH